VSRHKARHPNHGAHHAIVSSEFRIPCDSRRLACRIFQLRAGWCQNQPDWPCQHQRSRARRRACSACFDTARQGRHARRARLRALRRGEPRGARRSSQLAVGIGDTAASRTSRARARLERSRSARRRFQELALHGRRSRRRPLRATRRRCRGVPRPRERSRRRGEPARFDHEQHGGRRRALVGQGQCLRAVRGRRPRASLFGSGGGSPFGRRGPRRRPAGFGSQLHGDVALRSSQRAFGNGQEGVFSRRRGTRSWLLHRDSRSGLRLERQ
jgi:hypothetical protein